MPRLAKLGLIVVGGVFLTFVAAFAVLSLIYSPTYIIRLMMWQEADVQDHTRFPAREIDVAPESFSFERPSDPARAAEAVQVAMVAKASVGDDMEAFLAETGTQAFIVIQDDVVLYERFFGGFDGDAIGTSFSVAKSYVSTLVGIAIEEGAIHSAEDPITDYLPELLERDQRFADISIQDLLDMTSGIRYVETGFVTGDDALTYYFDDLRALALDRTEIERSPGQTWHYNNYNPLLLGLILERATGVTVSDYLAEKLWTRIGTESPASWSLDSAEGFEKMESGINARAIDFAKLGRLYLEEGSWNGQQVIPADWVRASTLPSDDQPAGYYPATMAQPYGSISHGMYWWRIRLPDGGYAFSAVGNHGQYVFVAPAERLIVVRLGERYGIRTFAWFEAFVALADNLNTE